MTTLRDLGLWAALALALAGAALLEASQARPAGSAGGGAVLRFADVTTAAGIGFRHTSGAFGKKYLPETMGSGVAFVDLDDDGHPDLFFVNGRQWPGRSGPRTTSVFYRNDGNGKFSDATARAGLALDAYGMGVTAADYDNDGRRDLYVTALGGNRLFRNAGGGRFMDVTAKAGVGGGGFSTSAMFFDYDRDGHLDLFVATYVRWSIETDLTCTLDGRTKSYCTPESYPGDTCRLYRNRGDGTFADVTKAAGILDTSSKALGVAMLDENEDGWMDVFVANDTQPNRLYRNNRNGTFTDVGVSAGIAFAETGVARAGMGVDAADYAGNGRPGLVVGNFSNEMMGLYRNEGKGLFVDDAPASGVGRASLPTLTFGAFFFDADLDGLLDIFAANGHVADDISAVQPRVTYAQPPHLFRNLGRARFEDAAGTSGSDLGPPMVARGAAYADYDGDGDLDIAVSTNGGPARLFRNDAAGGWRWLRVSLEGTKANRDGIGARVSVKLPDGRTIWRHVHTGSSYCSQSELTLTFGAAAHERVDEIVVSWPSGTIDRVGRTPTNQTIAIVEGQGIVRPPAGQPR